VITLGRLTRLAKHLGELIDRDFGTWSLLRVADPFDTETASSVFCSAYWHRCAREERRGISEGIKDILPHIKAKHERIVGGPYGWQDTRDDIHLEANAEEQAIVQAAHDLKERGVSLRQIGHELTEATCLRHLVALGILRACRTC
jgi:hypothetical protein